jgi:NADPH:quinone reductase-like Zn-dependent oxidoreductase
VLVPVEHLTPRPPEVPWEVAGSLFVVGTTAYAVVRAIAPQPGETVVVAGAAGGVGTLVVQLARRTGATVIGIASPANHAWLAAHGVVPVAHGDGVADRIREVTGGAVDAFADLHGDGYVQLALELGVAPDRIDTIVDFGAVQRLGVRFEGQAAAATAAVVAELAALVAKGELEVDIAATYPLDDVRAAFTELERGHTRGKIVLLP